MPNQISNNNTRIAKNTLLLYFRMLFTMAVSLYTSRVVLNTLGVENFGVYNVVGGIVSMLGFFNSSMATSTQRFLNYEMGRNNGNGLREVFVNALNAHYLIGIITVIGLETVGLWFVYNKLNVPLGQFESALWVFHCSVLSLFVSIISTPYNAAIIANERMGVYAYYSIIEVVLKLLIVYLLVVIPYNKLIMYGLLTLTVSVVMRILYNVYCVKNFAECKYKWSWNIQLMKKMFFFSSWMLFGCISDILSKQGVNVLINVFFGPVFNAARAIAVQVQAAVNNFVANFMAAVSPQIIKSYSAGEVQRMHRLVFSSSKLSFYLLFVLTTPVLIYTDLILQLWLKQVPEYCVLFTRLVLVELLISSAYVPIAQINQASGKIRNYQMTISIIFVVNFALTYILYKIGMPVYSTFVVSVVLAFIGLFVRVVILKYDNGFPASTYLLRVMLPLIPVAGLALFVPILIYVNLETTFLTFVLNCLAGLASSVIVIWTLGLDKVERAFITEKISSKIHKNRK